LAQIVEQVQKVLAGNRITLFDDARKKLGLNIGDFVIVRLEDGSLRIIPAEVKPKEVKQKE
jgi:bifunctional DNA-binding transcriptional regulator/antitoxin component of YhaV-PrlF toxin-antitoxin module